MANLEAETEQLWYWALHGSPITAAMALALLDKELDGEISKLASKILNLGD